MVHFPHLMFTAVSVLQENLAHSVQMPLATNYVH